MLSCLSCKAVHADSASPISHELWIGALSGTGESLCAGTQVKLRGFRVELGEIEHALADVPGVELVVVLVLKDPAGTQRLVAYVTPAAVDPAAVLAAVGARLPAHMVPSVVMPLDAMPRLPNGKVSRSALPQPEWGAAVAEEYVAPVNELEARLQAVWQRVLGRERISTQADFFAVGGNSLQARLRRWLSD